jgi:GTP1/Obg family GTP-binding protein
VGKSSIVRVVSSGTPEVRARACPHVTPFSHDSCVFFCCLQVNDYPFTTRGVTIGHITDGGPARDLRFQVMDTP